MRKLCLLIALACSASSLGAQADSRAEDAKSDSSTIAPVSELIQMGNAMADLRRYDQAITAYSMALRQEPSNPVALANRALAYGWTNRVDEALKDLAEAEKVEPGTAVLHRVRAIIANRQSDEETELLELTKSLQIEPGNPFALSFRSSIYQRRQQYDAALADAESYIRARPDEPEAYEMRADVLAAQQKWPQVLAEAKMIATRFARDPRALASAARLYRDAGDRPEALRLMADAISQNEDFYYLWRVRAGIRSWDDFVGRRLDLVQALELAEGDLGTVAQLALLEFDTRNWKAAHARLSEVLAREPEDFGILAYRGMASLKMGDEAAAKRDLDAAFAAARGVGDLSRLCGHLGDEGLALDRALAACDQALNAEPKRVSFLANRARVRLRLGDLDGAISDYSQAIEVKANSATAHYGRAVALRRKGNMEASDRDRAKAVTLSPTIAEDFVRYGFGDLEKESQDAAASKQGT